MYKNTFVFWIHDANTCIPVQPKPGDSQIKGQSQTLDPINTVTQNVFDG